MQISCLLIRTNQTSLPCELIMLFSYRSRQKVIFRSRAGQFTAIKTNPLPLLFIPGVSKMKKKIKDSYHLLKICLFIGDNYIQLSNITWQKKKKKEEEKSNVLCIFSFIRSFFPFRFLTKRNRF